MSKAQLTAIRNTALAIASARTARSDPGYLLRQIRRVAEMVAELSEIMQQTRSVIVADTLTSAGEEQYRRELEAIKSRGENDEPNTGRLDDEDDGSD